MAIKGVSANVAIQTREVLDKILITGQKGFSLVTFALKTAVLGNRAQHPQQVPLSIMDRVNQIKEFLENVRDWLPMEKSKRALPSYRRMIMKERGHFVQAIKGAVIQKLRELRGLNKQQRKELIQQHRERLITLAQEKEQSEMLRRKLQERMEALRRAPIQDDDPSQSDPYDLQRTQWRIHLTERMNGESLSMNEFSRVAHMVDMDKYPKIQAYQLTESIHFAKWLASDAIYELVMQDKLVFENALHQVLLTSPSDAQMRRLSLLSPFILKEGITIQNALECYIDETCYTLLDDEEFQERTKENDFTQEDKALMDLMGIAIPEQPRRQNTV